MGLIHLLWEYLRDHLIHFTHCAYLPRALQSSPLHLSYRLDALKCAVLLWRDYTPTVTPFENILLINK